MSDTLFSIDQFWEDSKVDVVFRNERCIVLPRVGDQPEVKLPFRRENKLYCWNILPLRNTAVANVTPSEARVLKASTIHAPSAVTHIASLPAEQAVDVLHRRLHASIDTIRRLADMASDSQQRSTRRWPLLRALPDSERHEARAPGERLQGIIPGSAHSR